MHSARWVVSLLVLSLILSACASSSSSSEDSSSAGSSDAIVVDELSFPVAGMSAYELVNQYNSNWLRKRGSTSFNNEVPIKVYLDNSGSAAGTISYLRNIQAVNVASIHHYDASEAQFKFGLDNTSGAILVRTKSAGE